MCLGFARSAREQMREEISDVVGALRRVVLGHTSCYLALQRRAIDCTKLAATARGGEHRRLAAVLLMTYAAPLAPGPIGTPLLPSPRGSGAPLTCDLSVFGICFARATALGGISPLGKPLPIRGRCQMPLLHMLKGRLGRGATLTLALFRQNVADSIMFIPPTSQTRTIETWFA